VHESVYSPSRQILRWSLMSVFGVLRTSRQGVSKTKYGSDFGAVIADGVRLIAKSNFKIPRGSDMPSQNFSTFVPSPVHSRVWFARLRRGPQPQGAADACYCPGRRFTRPNGGHARSACRGAQPAHANSRLLYGDPPPGYSALHGKTGQR
jgi:hypothetical protein